MSVQIYVDLSHIEALALSQFLKRIGFSQFRELAIDDEDAYNMQSGASKVANALAEAGYNPR